MEIDLDRLRARWPPARPPWQGVVGHLAHLLPVAAIVVLRCHPIELAHRLSRARRGSAADRFENVACEAIDLIAEEARARPRPVREIDTTGRTPRAVAREVARWLAHPTSSRPGEVRWLDDPDVTDYLLHRRP